MQQKVVAIFVQVELTEREGEKKKCAVHKSFRQTTFENAWREEQREEFLWKIPSETIVLRTSDDRL